MYILQQINKSCIDFLLWHVAHEKRFRGFLVLSEKGFVILKVQQKNAVVS
jgi:hypothetical protein